MTLTVRPHFNATVAVALLEQGHCACFGCNGHLVRSDRWPSWRRCPDCGCHWTISDISGRRREGLFASPTCPARRGEEGA